MSLKTRLDGRSDKNSSFELRNDAGELMATVKSSHKTGITLEIETEAGYYIEKPSGWTSKPK